MLIPYLSGISPLNRLRHRAGPGLRLQSQALVPNFCNRLNLFRFHYYIDAFSRTIFFIELHVPTASIRISRRRPFGPVSRNVFFI